MITPKVFDGISAFNNFVKEFKERGNKPHFFIYLGIFLLVIFSILMIPALLFVDLCILIFNIIENITQKNKSSIIKDYKKRSKK